MNEKLINLSISELHFVCVRLSEQFREAMSKPNFDQMEEYEKRLNAVQSELDSRIINLF